MKNFILPVLALSLVLTCFLLFTALNNQQQAYTYTHPAYNVSPDRKRIVRTQFMDLRKKLHQESDPYGNSFSVYFEYLPTGESIGINDKKEFPPNSLFKPPVAVAYYKGIEERGVSVDSTVSLLPEDINNRSGSLWKKGPGYQLPLSEVVRIMLEDSDNTAYFALIRYVSKKDVDEVYSVLNLKGKVINEEIITTPGYASILKSLYYASILDKNDSELLLNYLAHTKYNKELPAGVSKDVVVAHKIGTNERK